MNLHEVLLNKAKASELAHFYILETSQNGVAAHEGLFSFVQKFICDYFKEVDGNSFKTDNLMNHPDVYILGNHHLDENTDEKYFKVEDAQAFARFFEFKPLHSKRKFAVITEGHRINTTIANKWLKLLEEPHGLSTIFLLNPRKIQLLPTIHSRAIHLRLAHHAKEENFAIWNEFLENVKKMELSQFLETYSRGEKELSFWVNELIRWEGQKMDNYISKNALEDWLRSFEEMETFHQPLATRWSLFYKHLTEHVLSRL